MAGGGASRLGVGEPGWQSAPPRIKSQSASSRDDPLSVAIFSSKLDSLRERAKAANSDQLCGFADKIIAKPADSGRRVEAAKPRGCEKAMEPTFASRLGGHASDRVAEISFCDFCAATTRETLKPTFAKAEPNSRGLTLSTEPWSVSTNTVTGARRLAPWSREFSALEPGVHGLSNALLDTPWPKIERGKALLRAVLQERQKPPGKMNRLALDLRKAGVLA